MDKTTTWMIRAACGVVIAIPSLLVLVWISDAVLQSRLQEEQRRLEQLMEQRRAKEGAQYARIRRAQEAIEYAESGVGLTKAEAWQLLQEACDAYSGYHDGCDELTKRR